MLNFAVVKINFTDRIPDYWFCPIRSNKKIILTYLYKLKK